MTVQEILDKYDSVITVITSNIYSLNKNYPVITLRNFDWKNKEHKLLFYITINIAHIFDKGIAIDCNWLTRLWLNIRFRRKSGNKSLFWLKPITNFNIYDCNDILNKSRQFAIDYTENKNIYTDIYTYVYQGKEIKNAD